ncbi:MAG: pyridoxamine 5'-phosphate oxidase family protein [Actinomycetota bacterium]
MSGFPDGVEILTPAQCWELLTQTSVGRLAVDVGGTPDIFPINYVVDGESIVFRSGAGTKLAASVLMHHVAFEIDGYVPDDRIAWSVVVKGRAHEVERMDELFAAEDLPLFPWVAFPKPNIVRITPTPGPEGLSGRRFHVMDDAKIDASVGWEPTETERPGVAPKPGEEFHPGAPKMRPD